MLGNKSREWLATDVSGGQGGPQVCGDRAWTAETMVKVDSSVTFLRFAGNSECG